MKRFRLHAFCLFFLSCAWSARSQSITGTWEGTMSNEFIQINVEQRGNQLCGYTFDYELNNKRSNCIARFEGIYDAERKLWYISGKSFIENSGSHVFMRIILTRGEAGDRNELRASVYTPSYGGSFAKPDEFMVRKVSSRPQSLGSVMEPCFPKTTRPSARSAAPRPATPRVNEAPPVVKQPTKPAASKPIPTKPIPEKPVAPKPAVVKPAPVKPAPAPIAKPAPSKPAPSTPVEIKKPSPSNVPLLPKPDRDITSMMNARKKTEQSRLEVNVKKINLKVYDNGIVDNDTVSIFYNGKLLLSHQRLSETAIEFNLDLDEGISQHEIIMYAENLGGIPPNTALIVITAGGKRYELRSKASLVENAVLVIEYKPKPDF